MEPIRTTDPTGIDFRKKFELNDKVIIITGACGLVGRAFCEAVAQFGGIVVAADIELAKPEEFAAALSERNKVPAMGFALDVANRTSVEALKTAVLEKFGRIDGLVNAHQNKTHLKVLDGDPLGLYMDSNSYQTNQSCLLRAKNLARLHGK